MEALMVIMLNLLQILSTVSSHFREPRLMQSVGVELLLQLWSQNSTGK
jgi:hypothetical protein